MFIDKDSFKMRHTRLTRFFSLSNTPMTSEGHWYMYACTRGCLDILWHHKYASEENMCSIFTCFLQWNFVKVCILHDIDAYFTNINYLQNFIRRFLFFKLKKWNCTIFKNPLHKFFIFSNWSIVWNRFHKTAEFQDILPRLTLEKEANRWKIAKKELSLCLFVAMATVCNILIWTKMESQVCP